MAIEIRKADGTFEPFRVSKLRTSLIRSGASHAEVADITRRIEQELRHGMSTESIYRRAFEMLREGTSLIAARYSLRRAMVGLGPTGFPFENYLAELLAFDGFTTRTRVTISGRCAPHEIDVLAYKGTAVSITEAKFHLQPGTKTDLQVVLYSYARFLDLKGTKAHPRDLHPISESWVVTNTKFTTTAIRYAECAGVNLLSWEYPKKHNLQDRIETSKLYPITVLQNLSVRDKKNLLEQGVVLCRDLIDNHKLLYSAGVPRKRMSDVMDESSKLCKL